MSYVTEPRDIFSKNTDRKGTSPYAPLSFELSTNPNGPIVWAVALPVESPSRALGDWGTNKQTDRQTDT